MTDVRAAVFSGDGRVELLRLPMPECPAGGALLRIEAVGLCGTDLAQFHGKLGMPGEKFPLVPGHEIVGRIAAVDPGVAARWGVGEGSRVAVDEVRRCGECDGCRRFEPTCQDIGIYGITFGLDEAPGLWGGCAEIMVLKPDTIVHRIESALPPEELTLFEPLASAIHWAEVVGVRAGDTVVVQGPGHQGLACVVAALAAGAGRVIVTGRHDDGLRLQAAISLGAQHVIDVDENEAVECVAAITSGRMADVVLDVAAGSASTVPLAVNLARPRGRIGLAGFKHGKAVEGLVSDRIVLKKLSIHGLGGSTFESMRAAVSLLGSGRIDVGPLRGEVLSLDDLPEAMQLLARAVPGRDAVRVSLRIG